MPNDGEPNRDLNLIVAAVGVSAFGDWLAGIALALEVERLTNSGLLVALFFIALWGPLVVLAGPAGLIVDRLESTRILAIASGVQAVIALILAFSGSSVAAMLGLTALLGAGAAIAQPAEFALVPVAATGLDLAKANGRVETSRYLGMTAGPLAGGLVAAMGGLQVALLVDAATFVLVVAFALALRVRRHPEPAVEGEPQPRARDGFALLFRERTLAVVMWVAFVSLLFMTASATAEVFFATDVLQAGDVGYGALMTSWTLGMAMGAMALAHRVPRAALAAGALVLVAVQGAGIAIPTLWLVLPLALGGYVIGGLAHGTKNVLIRTLIQERTPDRAHGRAGAAYNALRNGAELFALAGGGVLVAAIGARFTLFLAGVIPIVAALIGLIVLRGGLRRLEDVPEASTA
jgi:Na+/melibiose symporter-like transporter